MIINEVLKLSAPFTMVLDDYHLVNDPRIHDLIIRFIDNPIDSFKLIVSGRFDPPFPLIDWRKKGVMREIRMRDLEFEDQDIADLLSIKMDGVKETLNSYIHCLTEGWISGIQLLAYDVKDLNALEEKVSQLKKLGGSYFHQLVRQTLDQQDAEIKRLILISSLLKSFSGELLNYIESSEKGFQLIQQLKASNLFVVELGSRDRWFRYHHLFHDALQVESLNFFRKPEVKEIYSKVAVWMLNNNHPAQAIEYYLKADSQEKAIHIFKNFRVQLLNEGNWAELLTVFRSIQKADSYHPVVRLTHMMILLYEGKVMEMFELSAQIERELQGMTQLKDSEHVQYMAELNTLLCYRTYHMEQDYGLCIKQCEHALKHLRSDFIYPRGYAWIFLIGSYQVLGDFDRAEKIAFQQLETNSSDWENSHIWFVLCYVYFFENQFDKLKIVAQRLVEYGTTKGNKEAIANGYYFLAKRNYTLGEWESAIDCSSKAIELGVHTIGIVRIFTALVQAAAFEKMGRLDQMNQVYQNLKEQTFLQGNSLLSLFVIGHEAEMQLLLGRNLEAENLIDQIPKRPLMPVTNSTDPHFAVLKHRIQTGAWEGLEKWLGEYQAYLEKLNNVRFLIEIHCFKSMLAHELGNEEQTCSEITTALLTAQRAGIISPFIDSGKRMEDILNGLSLEKKIDPTFVQRVLNKFKERNERHFNVEMSAREMDILQLFAKQLTNNEIGERLFISEKTVKNHSNTMFKKLSVKNRREAVQKAMELNLLNISGSQFN